MKRSETKEYKEYMHNYYLKHKFLPAKEHREDYCKSTKNPYGSKWHKHLYEVNNV